MCTMKFAGLRNFRGAFTPALARYVWGCAPVRCKARFDLILLPGTR